MRQCTTNWPLAAVQIFRKSTWWDMQKWFKRRRFRTAQWQRTGCKVPYRNRLYTFMILFGHFGVWLIRATRGRGMEKLHGNLTYGPHPMTWFKGHR